MAATDDDAALPLEISEAVRPERLGDGPRRCFLCLMDEEPSDGPDSWVDPCPCTLEAHQDCMLCWVVDCERNNKPLKCPVCKANIEMEGPWDLLVVVNDLIQRRFTRMSPYILFTGVAMGVQFSLQMYGALALWSFSGKATMMRFLLGPGMVLDARNVAGGGSGGVRLVGERIWSSLVMMNVAPMLVFGELLPNLSNKVFPPLASLYAFYQTTHDDTFFAWPPSPQLAIAVFPYVRSIYYNVWRTYVLPYENKLNRKLLGLPPPPPVAPNNDAQQDANQPRQAQHNGEGAFVGFLQGILDALGAEDDDDLPEQGPDQMGLRNGVGNRGEGDGGELMFELRIEEMDEEGEIVGENGIQLELEAFDVGLGGGGSDSESDGDSDHTGTDESEDDAEGMDFHDDYDELDADEAPPLAAGPDDHGDGQHEAGQHEAPQAPPRRVGLGALLSSMSNSVVSALILPGISFAMGEALRLALPRSWTAPASASRSPWALFGGPGSRPGLLQQQWGRSLVGGCLFVVLKDAIRVYTKTRLVTAMSNRRVKNVDRKRRKQ
ncbi:hypothetical protein E4U51_005595 [Claviceps purpurea]|nr:hypothetical protein E4U51_005595 [Claviceps purpurea]